MSEAASREDVAAGRIERMRGLLDAALTPRELELFDEGGKHVGHAGARDGRGHFRVRIVADAFAGLAPLARHRRVYAALGDMMQTDIHALAIDARAPQETEDSR